jgi:hypothetical protein
LCPVVRFNQCSCKRRMEDRRSRRRWVAKNLGRQPKRDVAPGVPTRFKSAGSAELAHGDITSCSQTQASPILQAVKRTMSYLLTRFRCGTMPGVG